MNDPTPRSVRRGRALLTLLVLLAALLVCQAPTSAQADEPTAGGLALPAGAPVSPADEEQARLIIALSSCPVGADAETLRGLTLDASQAALIALIEDPQVSNLPRIRAIDVLSDRDPQGNRGFVERFMASQLADATPAVTGRVARLVGDQLAALDPVWGLEVMGELARHAHPVVREYVVKALARMRVLPELQPGADELLVQLSLGERDVAVREALRRELAGVETLRPASIAPVRRIATPVAPVSAPVLDRAPLRAP